MDSTLQINSKYAVIGGFAEALRKIGKPLAFLVYGSVGRGSPSPESDVDAMLIFNDEDSGYFLGGSLAAVLPFDRMPAEDSFAVDEEDLNDLRARRIDFLRFKGKSAGEKVDMQFFPLSAIRKAASIFGGDLKGGTKIRGCVIVPEENRPRPTLTFGGETVSFRKNVVCAKSGRRLDFDETGIKFAHDRWIRGMTLGKLIAPRLLIDTIGFGDFLDNVIMRGLIRALLHNFELYVRDRSGCIIGVREEAADSRLADKLLKDHKCGHGQVYRFGAAERAEFDRRYRKIMGEIISRHDYGIFAGEKKYGYA